MGPNWTREYVLGPFLLTFCFIFFNINRNGYEMSGRLGYEQCGGYLLD